jgi:hypothetical protein
MIRVSRPFTVMARAAAPGSVAPTMVPSPVPIHAGATPQETEAWYTQWWVWTLIGITVAGGLTAAVLLSAPAAQDPPVGFTVQLNGFGGL